MLIEASGAVKEVVVMRGLPDEDTNPHHALNLIPARFFGVEGSWLVQKNRALVNGFLADCWLWFPADAGPAAADALIVARTNTVAVAGPDPASRACSDASSSARSG